MEIGSGGTLVSLIYFFLCYSVSGSGGTLVSLAKVSAIKIMRIYTYLNILNYNTLAVATARSCTRCFCTSGDASHETHGAAAKTQCKRKNAED